VISTVNTDWSDMRKVFINILKLSTKKFWMLWTSL